MTLSTEDLTWQKSAEKIDVQSVTRPVIIGSVFGRFQESPDVSNSALLPSPKMERLDFSPKLLFRSGPRKTTQQFGELPVVYDTVTVASIRETSGPSPVHETPET